MLVSIGEILVDIFQDENGTTILPGGAPFNVAVNSLLYTDKVFFVGAIGNDDNGKLLKDCFNSYSFVKDGIRVHNDRFTSKAIVTLENGERSFRFERDGGADYALSLDDIDFSLIKEGDIVHIGSLMLSHKEGRDFFDAFIAKIKTFKGVKVSFDINYRDDTFPSSEVAKSIFIDSLKKADILKFSIDELLFLSGEDKVEDALTKLLNDSQIAVITLGDKGSYLYKDRKLTHVNCFPLKPVDTTGAGDAFYSYFLSSLNNNPNFVDDPELVQKYLTRANVVGGIATLKKGAIGVAPSEKEIDTFINK